MRYVVVVVVVVVFLNEGGYYLQLVGETEVLGQHLCCWRSSLFFCEMSPFLAH